MTPDRRHYDDSQHSTELMECLLTSQLWRILVDVVMICGKGSEALGNQRQGMTRYEGRMRCFSKRVLSIHIVKVAVLCTIR